MSKLAAVLVSTLVFFVLAVSWLPSSFDPILNWFGPVIGPSFQILLALIFMLFGSPLIYSIVFTTWAITGIVVGLFARGLRSAIGAASLVYTFAYALLGIAFGAVFLQLNNSGFFHHVTIPPIPPGTTTASILNIPVFKQFAPLFLSGISGLTSGSSPLSTFSISSLLSTIVPSIIGGFVILIIFAAISGFAMGRISKMLRPSKREKWKPVNEPAAVQENKPGEAPPSQGEQQPVPTSVKTAAIAILAILLLGAGFVAFTNASYASSNFYAESVLSLVNPDGSATNYYTFLSGSFGLSSLTSSSMGPDIIAGVVASQAGNLGFLPQSLTSQFSKYVTLVPPTIAVLLYNGSCSSTKSEATSASSALSSAFDITGLGLLVSLSEQGSNLGMPNTQNICAYVYQSTESLSSMATIFENTVIPAFSSSGLISVFEKGLSSGFLIPSATSTSVNSSAIYAGFIEPQFLANIPVIGQMVSGSASSQSLLEILGGVAQQNSVLHSSSNEHTASFSQLTQYSSSQIGFASVSSFSFAGLAVPLPSNNSTSSIPNLSDFNYTIITTNPALLAQILGSGQNIISLSPGQNISSSEIQAAFTKLLPAYLSITKTFRADSNGTVTVTVTVLNNDNDSLTNLVMNDTLFTNAYASSLVVVSGNPLNSSVSSLAPSSTAVYSYIVKLDGIGTYSSSILNLDPAVLTYTLNGTQFQAVSSPAYYNVSAPQSIGAIGALASSVGGILDKAMNISSGTTLVYVILVALFAAAGFMEYRSFSKWRKG